jgi:1,2-phenylacetyl-CoA epoxidase PaaB subunit
MAKITLSDLANLNNQASAVATINANNALIEAAMELTLTRTGTSPNTMSANLDMNSNQILNLPAATDDTDPVRLGELNDLLEDLVLGEFGDVLELDNLTDVVITSVADNDFLRYDSGTSKWVNDSAAAVAAAPAAADYLVKTAHADLSAERVVTDNTSITWDWGTAGQAKALRAALTGDVTASSNSNATTIANDAVTYAKMQNVSAASRLLGRGSAGGAGDVEEITLGTGLSMSTTTLNATSPGTGVFPVTFVIAASDETTALTAAADKVKFRMPHAMTLTAVRASLSTTQTGGSIFTVDIHESGTTILSTKLTIDNGEKTSTTAATPPVISDSALADDAEITVDIDQIGDGTAKGLKVYLIGTRSV